jgi:steroid delta-isomerase
MMGSRDTIASTCDAYLAAVASGDADAMMALWCADPSVEDPIGSEPRRGRQLVYEFYANQPEVTMLRRLGPVTVAADYAGFQFIIEYIEAAEEHVAVITDLLGFDVEGRIATMRACPGPRVDLAGRTFR